MEGLMVHTDLQEPSKLLADVMQLGTTASDQSVLKSKVKRDVNRATVDGCLRRRMRRKGRAKSGSSE